MNPLLDNFNRHILPNFEIICKDCNANMNINEKNNKSFINPTFSLCCCEGEVSIPNLSQPPDTLFNLFTHPGKRGAEFRKNIRAYNSALAFTSLGANIDHSSTDTNSNVFTYRIVMSRYLFLMISISTTKYRRYIDISDD
jgi:hypothetical protein